MINNLLWFLSVRDVLRGVKVGRNLLGMSLAMVVRLRDAWPVKFDPTQVAFLLRAKGKQGRRQRPDLNLLAATEFAIGKKYAKTMC